MAENTGEGRGMRKKKRNGWLEKDDADAKTEDEAIAKRRRQLLHAQTFPDMHDDPVTSRVASVRPPPLPNPPIASSLTTEPSEIIPESTLPMEASSLTNKGLAVSGNVFTDVESPPASIHAIASSPSKIETTSSFIAASVAPSESIPSAASMIVSSFACADIFTAPSVVSTAKISDTKDSVEKRSTKARKDWPDEVKLHPEVTGGYITLFLDGTKVICHVCNNKELSCRHPYSFAPVFSESGHVYCDTHKKNLGSRQWSKKETIK
jgi:hypothetical protein